MKPTSEMVERAREFGKRFAPAWDDGSVWEGNYVTEGLDDTDLLAEALAIHVAQALADEHERAMERAAKIADGLSKMHERCSEEQSTWAFDEVADAIRAAAKGATDDPH